MASTSANHDAARAAPPARVTGTDRYRASAHVMACAFGEGTALLDGRTNTYFSLDPVGATVWEALQRDAAPPGAAEPSRAAGCSLPELCEAVAGEFDVTARDCRDDVASLVADLVANGLCEAAPTGASGATPPGAPAASGPA